MIEYIKEIIETMRLCKDGREADFGPRWGNTKPDYPRLLEALAEELQRLDPRDFEPRACFEFVSHRATIRTPARPNVITPDYGNNFLYVTKIKELLESFRGEGSGAKTRDFSIYFKTRNPRAHPERLPRAGPKDISGRIMEEQRHPCR